MRLPRLSNILLRGLAPVALLSSLAACAGGNYSLNLASGSAQYVSVAANPALTPAQLTLEAWVNIPVAGQLTIASRGDGDNGSITDYIFQLGDDGQGSGTLISFFGAGGWDASSSGIPLNTWTHVAVTYDGSSKGFYINGVLNRTVSRGQGLYSTPGSPLYIGRQGSVCNCNFFNGQLAEVRLWNSVRTASQIQADMNLSLAGPQAGLVAYYHLNAGSGGTAADSSGNGNTGTLVNGATWVNSTPAFLGTSARWEGPGAGSDSVVLAVAPASAAWSVSPNASWLHAGAGMASGTGSADVIFSFDANTGATRTATLAIGGQLLMVTQAGASYVATQAPLATLVTGLNEPMSVAVDATGNVYIADYLHMAVKEWIAASNTVRSLPIPGQFRPQGLALDGAGNLFITDEYYGALNEWNMASNTVVTLAGFYYPGHVAVDAAGNAYVADPQTFQVDEWSAGSQSTSLLVSGLGGPSTVAVDLAGNVYIGDTNVVKKWAATSQTTTLLFDPFNFPLGQASDAAVDGAGHVYVADGLWSEIREWSPVTLDVAVPVDIYGGLSYPQGVAVDGNGNIYIADTRNNCVKELARGLVDITPKAEGRSAGSDSLPPVLPPTQNLAGPFAPTSDQSWLTITGVSNGIVSFAFSANTGFARTANISLLGQTIPVTQQAAILGTAMTLTGAKVLANGAFQFAFTNTPGASFSVLSSTDVSLPLNSWTRIGAPSENPAGYYQFTDSANGNAQRFYVIRSP
jgi:sugar lactone lactonase YvrE